MPRGNAPYFAGEPAYSHTTKNGKRVYRRTSIALLPAFENQIDGSYYKKPITQEDCIQKLLERSKDLNIPSNKVIKVGYISSSTKKKATSKAIHFGLIDTNVAFLGKCVYPKDKSYGGNVWIRYDYFTKHIKKSEKRILSTIIHEIAHALGLSHPHCNQSKASRKTKRKRYSRFHPLSDTLINHLHPLVNKALDVFESYLNVKFNREDLNNTFQNRSNLKNLTINTKKKASNKRKKTSSVHRHHKNSLISKNIKKSQTWGDHGYHSTMSYVRPRFSNLMLHDTLALQRLWGRKKESKALTKLTLGVGAKAKSFISFLLDQNGKHFSLSYGPKVYDNKNINILNCYALRNTPLRIDSTGVYKHAPNDMTKHKPIAVFTNHTQPSYIVGSRKSNRILLDSRNEQNVIFSLGGNDIISSGRSNSTIVLGPKHGNVIIHPSRRLMKVIFLVDQRKKESLRFSESGNHIIIKNTQTGKTVKLVWARRWLGRLSIYDQSGLSSKQIKLLKSAKPNSTKCRLLQQFNPDYLLQPIYGLDIKNRTLILHPGPILRPEQVKKQSDIEFSDPNYSKLISYKINDQRINAYNSDRTAFVAVRKPKWRGENLKDFFFRSIHIADIGCGGKHLAGTSENRFIRRHMRSKEKSLIAILTPQNRSHSNIRILARVNKYGRLYIIPYGNIMKLSRGEVINAVFGFTLYALDDQQDTNLVRMLRQNTLNLNNISDLKARDNIRLFTNKFTLIVDDKYT